MKNLALPILLMISCFQITNVSAQSWLLSGNSGTTSSSFIGTTDNKPLKFKTDNGLRMTIKPNGNIGIGISSPDELLHLSGGKIRIDADLLTGNSMLRLNDPNGGNILMTFEEAGVPRTWLGFDHSTDDFVISATSTGTREDFIINAASGNVGIGTKTPAYKLQVEGPTFIDESLYVEGDLVMSSVNPAIVSGDIVFTYDQQDIGFTAPSNAFASPMLVMGGSSSFTRMLASKGLGGDINTGIRFDYADNQFDFTDAGTSRLSIDLTNGNIGIGETAPADRFEVHGGASSFFGNIGVQTAAGTRTIQCGATQGALIGIGTAEYIQDAGASTLSTNNNWVPVSDNLWSLGASATRWQDLWAVDGSINTSDATMKTNIRDINYGIDAVMQLRPVSFQWKSDQSYTKLGVIAQEIQEVLPEVVRDWDYVIDETTGIKTKVASEKLGVMYDDIIPVLIKGMQEQQELITGLQSAVNSLQTELESLKNGSASAVKTSSAVTGNARLEQNFPNPFDQSTTIPYFLPENSMNAFIQIISLQGEIIKSIPVMGKGKGQITLRAADLQSGQYQYSLFIEGKLIDTKQLNISK
ncbi:MAG: tail fiber domain-containing protein [Chitinophagales bacterium]|nr:tail fiber domain-containing protein [Chitinophagales bacterium]